MFFFFFFKLGDCLPIKKLVITKETSWQMLQDIKNQVKKKISRWAPLFQIIVKLGKLFTVTNLFKSCPFIGSWIYIQRDLDFYRFLIQCHNYWSSCTFNPFLGTFPLHILWFLYCACGFERRWIARCYCHGVVRMGLYRIILS